MASQYKVARSCECGYITQYRSSWCTHRKTCKYVAAQDAESDMVQLLRQQLAAKDEQMKEQLAVKDQQLAAKDEQIQLLLKKPRAPAKRKSLTEPERRDIAMAQGWLCANPDGECLLTGPLREYEVDHIIPLFLGVAMDTPGNMQALCPSCHSRKTKRDSAKRAKLDTSNTEDMAAVAALG